jgi:hypothetical protein
MKSYWILVGDKNKLSNHAINAISTYQMTIKFSFKKIGIKREFTFVQHTGWKTPVESPSY